MKDVDLDQARPGDVITYTITLSNPGVEGVREIEIVDPVAIEIAGYETISVDTSEFRKIDGGLSFLSLRC